MSSGIEKHLREHVTQQGYRFTGAHPDPGRDITTATMVLTSRRRIDHECFVDDIFDVLEELLLIEPTPSKRHILERLADLKIGETKTNGR